jgi:hypothetical protein
MNEELDKLLTCVNEIRLYLQSDNIHTTMARVALGVEMRLRSLHLPSIVERYNSGTLTRVQARALIVIDRPGITCQELHSLLGES